MEKEKDIERISSLDDYDYMDVISFGEDNNDENKEPILSNINSIELEQKKEKIEMSKSQKYRKLQKFLSSYFKYELLEEGIDFWFDDFEFAFWCDSNDTLEILDYLKSFDFDVVYLCKRFYHSKEDKQYFGCRIADDSEFFNLEQYNYYEEDSERISSLENYQCEEECITLDTEEASTQECKTKTFILNKMNKKILFTSLIVFFVFILLVVFSAQNKKVERISSLDYELPKSEIDFPATKKVYEPAEVMPLVKIEHYDLCFETKDGKREFKNSTYEKSIFNITVNSYFDYSNEIKGIYIFPRYSVKAIYAEVVE